MSKIKETFYSPKENNVKKLKQFLSSKNIDVDSFMFKDIKDKDK